MVRKMALQRCSSVITNLIMGKPPRSDILLQARDKTCRRYAEQILSALLTESYLTKVLNDFNATSTLLDKRGDIYSSRPRFVVAYDACYVYPGPPINPPQARNFVRRKTWSLLPLR